MMKCAVVLAFVLAGISSGSPGTFGDITPLASFASDAWVGTSTYNCSGGQGQQSYYQHSTYQNCVAESPWGCGDLGTNEYEHP